MPVKQTDFEQAIAQLTQPKNGQYPRPWMTNSKNPLDTDIFIIGKNQRNGYDCNAPGPHQRHLDALFNRNGETCRGIYEEMTEGKPSPTRRNIDRFSQMLNKQGVNKILETNVICYSSPMSSHLSMDKHKNGAKRGEELFCYLLESIKPGVLIVHGVDSKRKLSGILGCSIGRMPESASDLQLEEIGEFIIAPIPSLAPPAYNMWSGWADEYLQQLSVKVGSLGPK